jgi:hypothetical protein
MSAADHFLPSHLVRMEVVASVSPRHVCWDLSVISNYLEL